MTDGGEEARRRAQDRALDVHRPSGALLVPEYLERRQEMVAVNRDDLEDILEFDNLSAGFGAIGMFLLSGAVWLVVEKMTTQPQFTITMTIGVCAVAIVAGLAFLAAGVLMHRHKRGRITRIFNQTKRIG